MAPRRENVQRQEAEAEQVDIMVQVTPNHEFLKFANREWTADQRKDFKTRRIANLLKPVRAGEYVNWDVLPHIQGDGTTANVVMNEMTTMEYYRDDGNIGFTSYAWPRLFQIVEPIYREMVYEFFSSIVFRENMTDFKEDGMVSFQLCGTVRRMSLVNFAVAVGLYTEPETHLDNFDNHLLLGTRVIPSLAELAAHWGEFANDVFTRSGAKDSFIRDPRHRMLHRLITNTITARKASTEKVTAEDLFYLYSIINGHLLNVPFLLAKYMSTKATGRKRESSICGGQFVTRIARSLGLLTQANIRKCSEVVPGMRELTPARMVRMGIIHSSGYQGEYVWTPVKPVGAAPVVEEDEPRAQGGRNYRPLEQRMVNLEGDFRDFREEYRGDRTETRRSDSFVRGLLTDMMGNMHIDYTDYEGHRHSFDGQHRYFPRDVPPPQPRFYEQHPSGQYPPVYPAAYGPRYSFHAPAPPPFTFQQGQSSSRAESSHQGEYPRAPYESYAEGYARGGPRGRFDDPPQ